MAFASSLLPSLCLSSWLTFYAIAKHAKGHNDLYILVYRTGHRKVKVVWAEGNKNKI
jgi:hypothetical protein